MEGPALINNVTVENNRWVQCGLMGGAPVSVQENTSVVLRNNTDTSNAFVGIAFQAEAGFNSDRINAAIFAERVDSGASDVNSDLLFATNSDADDDLFERMRIHHDGFIEVISPNMISGTRGYFDGGESGTFSSDRYLDFNNGTQMTSTRGYRMSRPGSVTAVSMQFDVVSVPVEIHLLKQKVYLVIKPLDLANALLA